VFDTFITELKLITRTYRKVLFWTVMKQNIDNVHDV